MTDLTTLRASLPENTPPWEEDGRDEEEYLESLRANLTSLERTLKGDGPYEGDEHPLVSFGRGLRLVSWVCVEREIAGLRAAFHRTASQIEMNAENRGRANHNELGRT